MFCIPCGGKGGDGVDEPKIDTAAKASAPPGARATSRLSLPGGGTGFLDANDEAYEQAKALSQMRGDGTREIDTALDQHRREARALAEAIMERADSLERDGGDGSKHPTAFAERRCFSTYLEGPPDGCYFVGHTNTDMDSVAAAIGGAHLFGGVACRSERSLNGEVAFALEFSGYADWEGRVGVDPQTGRLLRGDAARKAQAAAEAAASTPVQGADAYPPHIDDVKGALDPYDAARGLVLVDHNEPGQMPPSVGGVAFGDAAADAKAAAAMRGKIKGVIDHHAVSDKFKSAGPCFVDIRPWGSTCSIIAHMYVRLGKAMPECVAKILLCGILSDTINLTSPTTSSADRLMATLLVFMSGIEHPNELASDMFKAKTRWFVDLGAYEMVRGDQKTFSAGELKFGWATVEVTAADVVLENAADILLELRVLKEDKGYDYVFLSVVDIIQKQTWLLLCGAAELELAKAAFGGATSAACSSDKFGPLHAALQLRVENTKMDLGSRVSRKLEFVPPVTDVLASGWTPPEVASRQSRAEEAPFAFVEKKGECCKLERRYSRMGDLERASRVKHGHGKNPMEA